MGEKLYTVVIDASEEWKWPIIRFDFRFVVWLLRFIWKDAITGEKNPHGS